MADPSGDARMVPACWINALPDDVLLHAISFLDARQLVQTSVLSRRWRNLWRSVRRINASRYVFEGMAGTWIQRDLLFKRFFNRFLMLRDPTPLVEFNLAYGLRAGDNVDWGAESEDANLWISHALQWNARSVSVSSWEAPLYLNPLVFASECFLTCLDLTAVVLFEGFFENLQIGCALLERLELDDCCIDDAEISSQTLKIFKIDIECRFEKENVSISIPSLIDLDYFSHKTIPPLLTNLGSLETATVSIGSDHTQLGDICQFLRGLSDVTQLDFSYRGQTLKMEKNFQLCPKFNNLTFLTLCEWCLCADFYALTVFLQNSPNLMKLILEIEKSPDTHGMFIGEQEERYFSCEHLEIVKIFCPRKLEDEPVLNNLEKFLVGNGISPDQIEIKNW